MMTVKHETAGGASSLFVAKSVEFSPATMADPKTLAVTDGDNMRRELRGGRAWIMNDLGATVARYELD
jgi:hypothetical protein